MMGCAGEDLTVVFHSGIAHPMAYALEALATAFLVSHLASLQLVHWPQQGWHGDNCELSLCNPPCQNGGKCTNVNQCDCTGTNYSGPQCDTCEFSWNFPANTWVQTKILPHNVTRPAVTTVHASDWIAALVPVDTLATFASNVHDELSLPPLTFA
jgi:hypothetical protein